MKTLTVLIAASFIFLGCAVNQQEAYREPPPRPDGTESDVWEAVHMVAAEYPPRAFKRRVQGWVVVEHSIEVDGSTSDFKIVDSFPKGIFERTTLRALQRFRYEYVGEGNPQKETGIRFYHHFDIES